MSETAKENQTSATSAEPVKKKGKKLIIIAIVAVLLLGGAGGGIFYWRSSAVAAAENVDKGGKKSRAKKEAADAEKEAEKSAKESAKSEESNSLKDALPDDEDVKNIIELQPFIINLADTEQARYLRLTVSLGIGGEEGSAEKPNPLFITRVRNAMLAVLQNKKSEEVLSVEGKSKLRKELLKAAQAASEEPAVSAIYITDFIVQL
jgi:flagellar FliL protein